jgi:small conductance mechanosensitive channel
MDTLLSMFYPEQLATDVKAFLPRLVVAALLFLLFWALQRFTRPLLSGVLRRANLQETLIHMLVDHIYAMVLIILGLVTAAAHLGINVTAALAGISVAGIAVGLAAQDSLSNMIAGFLIFWDKPFFVGDYVTVMNQYGQVVEITMRSTRIRTQQNTYVVIPNKHIIDSVLVNHTKHGDIRVEVEIGIAYKESVPEARRVMLAAVSKVDGVLADPAPDVVVLRTGASSVDLMIRTWINDAHIERRTFYRTTEACKLALDEAGIQIPYPHLQLFVDNVEDRVWKRAASLLASPSQGARDDER